MKRKIYEALASIIDARLHCLRKQCETEDAEHWGPMATAHEERIGRLMASAPSGAGIDNGTTMDLDESDDEKLVFEFDYHHMDDVGQYTHWSTWKVFVSASLTHGIDVSLVCCGKPEDDDDNLGDHLYEVYNTWLNEEELRS